MKDMEYVREVIRLMDEVGEEGADRIDTFEIEEYVISLKDEGLSPQQAVERLLREWNPNQ